MPHDALILGQKDYEIKQMYKEGNSVVIEARYTGAVSCPHCGSKILRVYRFKQELTKLLRIKERKARECKKLIPKLLKFIGQLEKCGLTHLEKLGRTLGSWDEEVAAMWRFTKNNGITEVFHNKMEMLSRRAFGFRNFENYYYLGVVKKHEAGSLE